jgi:hypothetical protein
MSPKRSVVAPEKQTEGRFLYEQTFTPMEDIAALLGISRDTLRKRVKEWGWNRRAHDPYAARRWRTAGALSAPPVQQQPGYTAVPEERLALIRRLYRFANQQMDALEAKLPVPRTSEDAERNSRSMAGLLRTLRELALLEMPPPQPQPEPEDDDELPHDVDELRRELSRKLAALVAGREGAVPSGA